MDTQLSEHISQLALWGGLLILLCIFCALAITYRIRKRKYYHDLSRKKSSNHVHLQILMMACILLAFFWVCIWCAFNHVSSDSLAWFAGVGVLLTWIFQDTIKNIAAYFTLLFNNILHLGDWIIVENYDIDGEVADISLTSVIAKNWDGTLSSISTQSLLNTNMQNLQNVLNGDTPGRRMIRNFPIDIPTIRTLSQEEMDSIKQKLIDQGEDISAIEYAENTGIYKNIQVFRIYLRHWLLSQDSVSRNPYLFIRLMDITPDGLPLQVYTYLLPTRWEEFEEEQTRITEHIIYSMGIFHLELFQNSIRTEITKIHMKKKV